jgi:hypothetical protein
MMALCAVGLTLLSEFLQNLWSSVTFNASIIATMSLGFPSLLTAMVNNLILFPTVGTKAIEFVQENHLNGAKTPGRTEQAKVSQVKREQ